MKYSLLIRCIAAGMILPSLVSFQNAIAQMSSTGMMSSTTNNVTTSAVMPYPHIIDLTNATAIAEKAVGKDVQATSASLNPQNNGYLVYSVCVVVGKVFSHQLIVLVDPGNGKVLRISAR